MLLLLCSQMSLYAQWQQTGNIYGGPVSALVTDTITHYIYAGGIGGIYISKNNGDNWDESGNGLTTSNIVSVVVYNDKVWAGSVNGIFVSENNGESWTPANSGLIDTNITSLVVCNNELFAGTRSGLFSYDYNSGTWLLANSDLSGTTSYVTCMASVGNTLFAGTSYAGVFLSEDNGITWSALNNGPDYNITCLGVNGTTLFAGTPSKGIYRSSDNGSSWNVFNEGGLYYYINSIISHNDTVYMLTRSGIFTSSDNGITWNGSGLTDEDVKAIVFLNTGTLAASYHGIYCSTDGGNSWDEMNNGLSVIACSSIITHGNTVYAGISGVSKSSDFCNTFSSANGTQDIFATTSISQLISLGNYVYALTNGGVIYYTIDEGNTWNLANSGLSYVYQLAASGNIIYAATDQGVFKTLDYGINWQQANAGTPANIGTVEAKDNIVFAGTWDGNIYISNDFAETWSLTGTGPTTTSPVNKIFFDGTLLFAGTIGSGLYRSADYGDSWSVVADLVPANAMLYTMAEYDNYLLAGTSLGFSVSNDGGISWLSANEGLMVKTITSLCILNGTVFASVLYNGIWKRPLYDLGIVTSLPEHDNDKIFVYPNPSRDALYVSGLSESAKFCIYDLYGRRIISGLFKGPYIDLSKLSPGIYHLVINENSHEIIRKFIKL